MALSIGDEVFVTRINSAYGKVIFEGKERVTLTSISMNTSNVSFNFTPDIDGNIYFSSRFGDTYEKIPKESQKDVELVREPKTTKFKVGDRLKQVKEGNSPSSLGQIIEITEIDPDDENQFYSANNCGWTKNYLEENFELLETEINRDFLNCTFTTSLCGTLSADISTESMLNWYHNHSEIGRINRTNKINKKMETTKSIVEFAKNLTLSKEEKLLRKANLKDSDGDWTASARVIVKEKRAKEFGYKSWYEMTENLGEVGVSAIEYAQLFDKYKDELIKIATEFEKENKKK